MLILKEKRLGGWGGGGEYGEWGAVGWGRGGGGGEVGLGGGGSRETRRRGRALGCVQTASFCLKDPYPLVTTGHGTGCPLFCQCCHVGFLHTLYSLACVRACVCEYARVCVFKLPKKALPELPFKPLRFRRLTNLRYRGLYAC